VNLLKGRLQLKFCKLRNAANLILICVTCSILSAQVPTVATDDTLLHSFAQPPESAKPRVWWHWMNGNITKEGIKLDLDWMHRSGIQGVTIFEGAIDTPQVVPRRLVFMTPEWKDAFI
jgi:hypothetical protein